MKLVVGILVVTMYLIDFKLLKSLELTNDNLEIGNLMKTLIWGSPYDATIDINNVLPH
jgi:hypothetical protein